VIGVIAADGDLWAIQEFFELFKTPWELCRDGRRYPVVVCALPGAALPDADLTIVYGLESADSGSSIQAAPSPEAVMLVHRGRRFPVYGGCSNLHGSGKELIVREDSGQIVAWETCGGRGKAVRVGYDLFGEVRVLLSRGQPLPYASFATLDLHIAILRELIVGSGLPLAEIPPVPPGCDLILCLTHDVDFVRIRDYGLDRTVAGFLYRATALSVLRFLKGQLRLRQVVRNLLAVLSLPFVHLGIVADFFDQFDGYRKLEDSRRSTFFLVPRKNVDGDSPDGRDCTGRATRYQADELKSQAAVLLVGGWEVGLHGLDAWHDGNKAGEERAAIARVTGKPPAGVRIHWLQYFECTPLILEQAGFAYDSTWGYNEGIGFRAGTAQVFRPPGAERLLELPLHAQDTALFSTGRMNLTQSQGIRAIEGMLQDIRSRGGVFTVNWHMRSLGPERLWDEPYRYLLGVADEGSVWSAKAEEVVDWFAMRRRAVFSSADPDHGPIQVHGTSATPLPGLIVRRYNVSGQEGSAMVAEVLASAGTPDAESRP